MLESQNLIKHLNWFLNFLPKNTCLTFNHFLWPSKFSQIRSKRLFPAAALTSPLRWVQWPCRWFGPWVPTSACLYLHIVCGHNVVCRRYSYTKVKKNTCLICHIEIKQRASHSRARWMWMFLKGFHFGSVPPCQTTQLWRHNGSWLD